MAFPVGWPPRSASGRRSIRFFVSGTSTANFSDNAWLFFDTAAANPFTPTPVIHHGDERTVAVVDSPMGGGATFVEEVHPMIWSSTIRVCNDAAVGGEALEFSFDGVNVHGRILATEEFVFRNMHEAGISVRGVTGTPAFRIFAW